MAGSDRFTGIIEAKTVGEADLQRFTQALEKTANALDKSGKSAESNSASFDKFASGVKNAIQNPLQAAGNAAEAFLQSLGPMGAGLAVAGTAALVAGKQIFDFVSVMGKAAEQQINAAGRIGVSVGQYQQFSAAARIAGVDIGSLESGMRKLSEALAGNSDEGEKGKRVLRQLGVDAKDSYGQLKPMGELITEIGAAIARLPGGPEQQLAIKNLFGRGGAELLPLFQQMPQLMSQVKGLGVGIDENLTYELAKLDDEIDKLGIRWDQFKRKVAGGVAIQIRVLSNDGSGLTNADRIRMGAYAPGGMPGGMGDELQAPKNTVGNPGWAIQEGLASRANEGSAWNAYFNSLRSSIAIEQRLTEARKNLKEAELAQDEAAHKKAIASIQSLEFQLKFAKSGEESAYFIDKGDTLPPAMRMRPSLFGRGGPSANVATLLGGRGLGTFQTSEADITGTNSGSEAASLAQSIAYLAGMKEVQERGEALSKASLEHQIRMVDLLSGPGGEIAAIEKIYQLRISGAKTELETQDAINQRQEALLQLHKQQVEQYVSLVQGATNALLSGGGGLGSFLKGQGVGLLSTVAGNATKLGYDKFGSMIPHAGEGTMLGGLLSGTPFGADPLKAATDQNTLATIANTRALMTSASGGGGGLVRTAAGGLSIPSFGGSTGGGGGSTMDALDSMSLSAADSYLGKPETLNFWGQHGNTILGVGAAAGGALGIYEGIKSGGARGALTAAGSAVAAAGSIIGLVSKSLSFLGPVGMIAGMGLGMLTGVFGDPKKNRAQEESDFMNAHRFTGADPVSYSVDMYGRTTDYDMRGNSRSIIVNNYHVQAMDAASFDQFLSKNADTLNRGVSRAIDQGGAMVPKMSQALGLS